MSTNPKIRGGLLPLKPDARDFSVGAIFAPIDVSEIPDDFSLGKLKVKDQGSSDFCSGYAVTSASELQEDVELSPLWQFAKTKELTGDWKSWGVNLRDACKSAVKFGSLPLNESPELAPDWVSQRVWDRDDIANWTTWPAELDFKAEKHKKASYFSVSKGGYKDLFDAVQGELWRNREDKRGVVVGALWRPEWITAESGVISQEYGKEGFGHAFLFIGKKTINGVPYLVAHLSNGDIGDNGEFYFSRNVVNKEIGKYGAFMFNDLPADYYKKTYWSFWQKLTNFIRTFL